MLRVAERRIVDLFPRQVAADAHRDRRHQAREPRARAPARRRIVDRARPRGPPPRRPRSTGSAACAARRTRRRRARPADRARDRHRDAQRGRPSSSSASRRRGRRRSHRRRRSCVGQRSRPAARRLGAASRAPRAPRPTTASATAIAPRRVRDARGRIANALEPSSMSPPARPPPVACSGQRIVRCERAGDAHGQRAPGPARALPRARARRRRGDAGAAVPPGRRLTSPPSRLGTATPPTSIADTAATFERMMARSTSCRTRRPS